MHSLNKSKSSDSKNLKAEKCQRIFRYLIDWYDERISRDDVARQIWWENYRWLKENCWWQYRNFEGWRRDQEYKYQHRRKTTTTGKWFLDFSDGINRPHKKGVGRGHPQGKRCLVAGGNRRFCFDGGKLSTEKKYFSGGDSISDFETVKSTDPIDLGFGRFVEVSLKSSPQGKEFVNIARGEFWADGNGNNGKRYQRSITIPTNNGAVESVINALKKITGQIETNEDAG